MKAGGYLHDDHLSHEMTGLFDFSSFLGVDVLCLVSHP